MVTPCFCPPMRTGTHLYHKSGPTMRHKVFRPCLRPTDAASWSCFWTAVFHGFILSWSNPDGYCRLSANRTLATLPYSFITLVACLTTFGASILMGRMELMIRLIDNKGILLKRYLQKNIILTHENYALLLYKYNKKQYHTAMYQQTKKHRQLFNTKY